MWRFRDGPGLAAGGGGANGLEADEPLVAGVVVLGLINAGKAEAMDVAELDHAMELDHAAEMDGAAEHSAAHDAFCE